MTEEHRSESAELANSSAELNTSSALEKLQFDILHTRVATLLETHIQNKTMSKWLLDDPIGAITQKVWEKVAASSDSRRDTLWGNLEDHFEIFISSKILGLDQKQAALYYNQLLEDAKLIRKTIITETNHDIKTLYAQVFPVVGSASISSSSSATGTSTSGTQASATQISDQSHTSSSSTTGTSASGTQASPQASDPNPNSQTSAAHTATASASTPSVSHPANKPQTSKPRPTSPDFPGVQHNPSILERANKFNPPIKSRDPNASLSLKDSSVKVTKLHPYLKAFAVDMAVKFPGLCITSGNDGTTHKKTSRHYQNLAIDIGKGSSTPSAYNSLLQYLRANEQDMKSRYHIEDFIGLRGEAGHTDHLHIELVAHPPHVT